jgi:hypothetical protein
MKLVMHRFQPLLIDMRINLRCRDIGVTEHFLNDAEVGAVAQQVRRETVPQKVRVNIHLQSRAARHCFDNLPDPYRR